ncbi:MULTISPECIES: L,D-transpeptidase [Sphingomonas]|uniref:L,D-transpeptidase n=1 Tax=Sphingomonas TaxID=13687 RepID=UPI000A6125D1|nr:L,D-transpeptidase [Sphingomonas sp. Leaf230]
MTGTARRGVSAPARWFARWQALLGWGIVASGGAVPGIAASPAPAAIVATAALDDAGRFGGVATSDDVRDMVNWVSTSHDNHALPFVVIDKVNAVVLAFDGSGNLRGRAPALLGMARGDTSVLGIGQRKLATITPAERTTPAGRFQASLGRDFEQDILWIDYDAALSLHRVIKGRRVDDRAGRLASATPSDNRISYGCVNVPPGFYDDVVKPLFTGTVGIVYILPETKPLRSVFAVPGETK